MARKVTVVMLLLSLITGRAWAQVPASCPTGYVPVGQGANHAFKCSAVGPLIPTPTASPTPTATPTPPVILPAVVINNPTGFGDPAGPFELEANFDPVSGGGTIAAWDRTHYLVSQLDPGGAGSPTTVTDATDASCTNGNVPVGGSIHECFVAFSGGAWKMTGAGPDGPMFIGAYPHGNGTEMGMGPNWNFTGIGGGTGGGIDIYSHQSTVDPDTAQIFYKLAIKGFGVASNSALHEVRLNVPGTATTWDLTLPGTVPLLNAIPYFSDAAGTLAAAPNLLINNPTGAGNPVGPFDLEINLDPISGGSTTAYWDRTHHLVSELSPTGVGSPTTVTDATDAACTNAAVPVGGSFHYCEVAWTGAVWHMNGVSPDGPGYVEALPSTNGTKMVVGANWNSGSTGGAVVITSHAAAVPDTVQVFKSNLVVDKNTSTDQLQLKPMALASCLACAAGTEGNLCEINNDLAACGFGNTITAGGSNKVLGVCNGTNYVMLDCQPPPQFHFDYKFADYGSLDSGNLKSCYWNELASTITKVTLTIDHFSCAVNPALVVEDCGTTVGACAAPVTLATHTATADGYANITISQAAIAASHYICATVPSGTCASIDWTYTVHGTVP